MLNMTMVALLVEAMKGIVATGILYVVFVRSNVK